MRYTCFILILFLLVGLARPAAALEVEVSVSSFRLDHALSYAPENLLDADPATAWVGGSASSGVGQWMNFAFPVPVRVARLGIFNGHQAEGRFKEFRRIRSGRIVYPDGSESPFWLRDEAGEQVIECQSKPVKSFRIVVDEVFPKGGLLGQQKLAVSEIKFYLTLMASPTQGDDETSVKNIPSLPPADLTNEVPEEIKDLLRSFYVMQTSLADAYHTLFAPHVRDQFDFQFEVFKQIQRQRGTYKILRTAEVDPSGLRFDLVYLHEDVAEVRVFGSYRVQVADLDQNLDDDSVFALMKGQDGWNILELDGQKQRF
ncbi:hypothetical protein GO013_12350 [Pseudodesulfovibrio sp. JC047]|uniref:NADase-type glycan-binding domain-containing protein n=1 Tax=Pseudodesulfovibrio sp. JC047 TaxID=2683199 RepID=UPI0013D4A3A9|nr:hypothetical protein [Pseudodesulfovibrio sp. JC047]NDV20205.1 hypothetical protein [Pseudodesulfovibrio sp. JC047]